MGSDITGYPSWPSRHTFPQPSNPEVSKLQPMSQIRFCLAHEHGFYIFKGVYIIYMQQKPSGLESLTYLLPGPLQEKFAKSSTSRYMLRAKYK